MAHIMKLQRLNDISVSNGWTPGIIRNRNEQQKHSYSLTDIFDIYTPVRNFHFHGLSIKILFPMFPGQSNSRLFHRLVGTW